MVTTSNLREFNASLDDFADNEVPAFVEMAVRRVAFAIDRAPVSWAAFLPFVESGGYRDAALWTPDGREWLRATGATAPLHLRPGSAGWEHRAFGRWTPVDPAAPAVQLTAVSKSYQRRGRPP